MVMCRRTLSALDVEKLEEVNIKSYIGHRDNISCCCFSSDWTLLATGGDDSTLRLWNIKENRLLRTLLAHTGTVKSICFSEDDSMIASGGFDALVCMWLTNSGTIWNKCKKHCLSVEAVAFSFSGKLLSSGSWDKTCVLWDVSSGRPLLLLDNHQSVVQCCAFSRADDLLATGSWDYTIHIYRVPDASRQIDLRNVDAQSENSTSSYTKTCEHNDNSKISLCRTSQRCPPFEQVIDKTNLNSLSKSETRLEPLILRKHSSNIKSVMFSNRNMLASASWDCTICLWDPYGGELLFVLSGHDGYVQSCAFSGDGLLLASAADDDSIKIWNVSNGQCIKTLDAHTDEIHKLAFTADGRLLASGPEKLSLCCF